MINETKTVEKTDWDFWHGSTDSSDKGGELDRIGLISGYIEFNEPKGG